MTSTAFEEIGRTKTGEPVIRFNTGKFANWQEFVGAFGFAHKGSALKRQLPNGEWVWVLTEVTVPDVEVFVVKYLADPQAEDIEFFDDSVSTETPLKLSDLLRPVFDFFPEELRKSLAANISRTVVLTKAPPALGREYAEFRDQYFTPTS